MLKEKTLFENIDKVQTAIDRIRAYEPPEGYYLAFSGGKDSIVLKQLTIEAGVKFDAHYSVTTIDPPDLIYYMREYHKDVIWDRPKTTFLKMITKNGFPTRRARWCCRIYKENGGSGRRVLTGIRWAESPKRTQRNMVEACLNDSTKHYVHPIIDWTDSDIWEFIKSRDLPYCKLYDEGWKRIGCLLCPMSRKGKQLHREKYPAYIRAFKRAFILLYNDRKQRGKTSVDRWESGEKMFKWWFNDDPLPKEETGLFT